MPVVKDWLIIKDMILDRTEEHFFISLSEMLSCPHVVLLGNVSNNDLISFSVVRVNLNLCRHGSERYESKWGLLSVSIWLAKCGPMLVK